MLLVLTDVDSFPDETDESGQTDLSEFDQQKRSRNYFTKKPSIRDKALLWIYLITTRKTHHDSVELHLLHSFLYHYCTIIFNLCSNISYLSILLILSKQCMNSDDRLTINWTVWWWFLKFLNAEQHLFLAFVLKRTVRVCTDAHNIIRIVKWWMKHNITLLYLI